MSFLRTCLIWQVEADIELYQLHILIVHLLIIDAAQSSWKSRTIEIELPLEGVL